MYSVKNYPVINDEQQFNVKLRSASTDFDVII